MWVDLVRKLQPLYTRMMWCSWMMVNVEDNNKNTWHRIWLISIIDKSAAQQVYFFQILSFFQNDSVFSLKQFATKQTSHNWKWDPFFLFYVIRSFISLACLSNISFQNSLYNRSHTICFNYSPDGAFCVIESIGKALKWKYYIKHWNCLTWRILKTFLSLFLQHYTWKPIVLFT